MTTMFSPTEQQRRIIDHPRSAFVAACPGAGKTRVMVERARRILRSAPAGQGIAFLSFTRAAVSEFEDRLRREGLVGEPAFPHFIGTFDAFLWQFLIAPFGIEGCPERPRLIPDKDTREIRPYPNAYPIRLECFDRTTGAAIPAKFVRRHVPGNLRQYEAYARKVRASSLRRGQLDFDDARDIALKRLEDGVAAAILGPAFAGRFIEVIVDEAQDCNPTDLTIISWFRRVGVPVTVVCDPNQAIYGFRGGVTRELTAFARTFDGDDRLPATGNFRSSRNITRGIQALKAPDMRAAEDEAVGVNRDEPTPVYILSYSSSRGVPSSIGETFRELTRAMKLDPRLCPVISAARGAAPSALGYPRDAKSSDFTYRLAIAVSEFHLSSDLAARREALSSINRILIDVAGGIGDTTYAQHLEDAGEEPHAWRSRAIRLADRLRYSEDRFADADEWHEEAKAMLAPLLPPGSGRTIGQILRRNSGLASALSRKSAAGHPVRTIHSVKGTEHPAVCVVMTSTYAKGIVDFLLGEIADAKTEEEARKIYVGASRAERLLAIALPKTQATKLHAIMKGMKADVELVQLKA